MSEAFDFGKSFRLMTPGLLHFQPEVVALAGALAYAGKYGEAAVLGGNVVDQLLDDDRLADTRAAEQAGFAALEKGLDEVDDLNARLEHLLVRGLLVERRSGMVDGIALLRVHRSQIVDRLADDVEHAAQRSATHGHSDGAALVDGLHAAHHAFGGFHGDAAHAAFAQMLLDLEDDVDGKRNGEPVVDHAQGLVNGGHGGFFELHVHRGTGNLYDSADVFCHNSFVLALRERLRRSQFR